MATNKQLFSIQKYLSSSAVDRFKLERVFEVNKAKTPQLYNDIVNDVQFLENEGLFILIDGEDVQVKYANGIKVWSDALALSGGGGADPTSVSWEDVTDKPTTYPPTIGTTATTAKAGNWNPSNVTTTANGLMISADKVKLDGIATNATANQTDANLLNRTNHTGTQAISTITGVVPIAQIPTGTTATTVALGNHTHAFTAITGIATTAQIPNLDVAKITTGVFNVARVNTVLGGYVIGTAGDITATDTLLQAIGKLEARIVALETAE